jgi:prevent-host-death family protein
MRREIPQNGMNKIPNLLPVSELRAGAAKAIKELNQSEKGFAVITQRGKAAAVLLSVGAYERTQKAESERLLLLRLLRGQREAEEGNGRDFDQVMIELDGQP